MIVFRVEIVSRKRDYQHGPHNGMLGDVSLTDPANIVFWHSQKSINDSESDGKIKKKMSQFQGRHE